MIEAAAVQRAPGKKPAGPTLADVLSGHLGYMLRRAQMAVFQDFCEQVQLRPGEYSVLLILRQSPGIRQNRLAEMLAIKPANCVILLNKLQKRGLLRREKLPVSGRAIALWLTRAGQALLAQADKKVEKHQRGLRECLGAEGFQQLLELLSKVLHNSSAAAPELDRAAPNAAVRRQPAGR